MVIFLRNSFVISPVHFVIPLLHWLPGSSEPQVQITSRELYRTAQPTRSKLKFSSIHIKENQLNHFNNLFDQIYPKYHQFNIETKWKLLHFPFYTKSLKSLWLQTGCVRSSWVPGCQVGVCQAGQCRTDGLWGTSLPLDFSSTYPGFPFLMFSLCAHQEMKNKCL